MAESNSHLIQILLPLRDNQGNKFPDADFERIQKVLADQFGGLTAYGRAPAEGVWAQGGKKWRDDILVVEVMAGELDVGWWRSFRRDLEKTLRQEQLVIRAHSLQVL